jgi:hypothetical protein
MPTIDVLKAITAALQRLRLAMLLLSRSAAFGTLCGTLVVRHCSVVVVGVMLRTSQLLLLYEMVSPMQ